MAHPSYWRCISPGCTCRWSTNETGRACVCPECGRRKRERLPSVTTVLATLGWNKDALKHWAWSLGEQGVDYREYTEREATVGSIVHLAVSAELHGHAFDLSSLEWDEDQKRRAARALDAWREWRDTSTLQMIGSEVSLCSRRWDFGGTMDAATIGNHVGVIDLKTGRCYPEALIQIAAYGVLWTEHHPEAPVEEYHLLGVGRDDGAFHHHRWPREAMAPAIEAWGLALELHRRRKPIEGML